MKMSKEEFVKKILNDKRKKQKKKEAIAYDYKYTVVNKARRKIMRGYYR